MRSTRHRTVLRDLQWLLGACVGTWLTVRHRYGGPARPIPHRPGTTIQRAAARNYDTDTATCDHCGYIFDPTVTSDIELITGFCQTCWANQYRMQE